MKSLQDNFTSKEIVKIELYGQIKDLFRIDKTEQFAKLFDYKKRYQKRKIMIKELLKAIVELEN